MEKLITAVKWFAYGLGVALLFAPRSGRETRQQLMQWAGGYASQLLDAGSQVVDRAAAQTQTVASQAAAKMYGASDKLQETGATIEDSTAPDGGVMNGGPA